MATEPLPWPVPIQHDVDEAMDWIGSLLWSLVNDAKAALVPTPDRVVHINVGQRIPWDNGCSQLAGRILTITPLTGPKGSTNLPCGVVEYIATLGITILRCVSKVDSAGNIPSAATMDADGMQMTRDLANLLRVIQCHPNVRTIATWTPQGVMGGVGGGEWTFTVRIPVCPCPDPVASQTV